MREGTVERWTFDVGRWTRSSLGRAGADGVTGLVAVVLVASFLAGGVVSGLMENRRDQKGSANGPPPLIDHPEHIQLGLGRTQAPVTLANPREHDPRALVEGSALFVSYNCADCHGDAGSGAFGPSLDDGRWHFGGLPGEVFESIAQGRPDGMPAWGGRISDPQIWALVTYVRSLNGGKDVSTENFEGATVNRGGR